MFTFLENNEEYPGTNKYGVHKNRLFNNNKVKCLNARVTQDYHP